MTEIIQDQSEEKTSTTVTVVKYIAKSSVKFVVVSAVTSLLPEPETKIQKIKVLVGTYVIADMVARNTGTYVEDKIDGWKKDIQEIREEVKKIEGKLKTDKEPTESPNS